MPVLGTERKQESEVIAAFSKIGSEGAINYHFATADVAGSGAVEAMGIPVVWNPTNDEFEVFLAQDISAITEDSSLPNGAPVAVVVGTKEGRGVNRADVTLSATAQPLTVMYRGEGAVKAAGIDFGAASAPNIALFKAQLEKQGIAVVDAAATAAPNYITA